MSSGVRQKIVDIVLVSCALVMVGLAIRNQFFLRGSADSPERTDTRIAEWREYQDDSRRVGAANAAVSIVLFTDYQCPFCRALWSVLDSLVAESRETISITTRHYPLTSIHPQARAAATFAECARSAGRFRSADSLLFGWRDSVRAGRWESLAAATGLERPTEIGVCMSSSGIAEIIVGDIDAAIRLGAIGTPLMLVNGRRVIGVRDLAQMKSLIQTER